MLTYFAVIIILFVLAALALLFERSYFGGKKYTLNVDGLNRTYKIHTPRGYKQENKYPLVIVLHAFGDNPTFIELNSGFSRKADKEKFIAVYPKGTGKKPSWNAKFCCGFAFENNIDDVKFIDRLVKAIEKDFAVDKNRIFVTGFSNGGMFAYNLASELSYIRAIGVVAAAAGAKDYKVPAPESEIAVIVFHGENDKNVPLDGGTDLSFLSVENSLENWIGQIAGKKAEDNTYSTRIVYAPNTVLYIVKNTGHVWFGGLQDYLITRRLPKINATDIMWDFFKRL